MALWATHIRFSLDLKNEYKIKNLGKYISGTIYPDSRYITKIDRNLTHGGYILDPRFSKDDFKKGWQVHQICDDVQHEIFRKNISFLDGHSREGWEEKKWVEFTAAKIIQDMSDMRYFDIQDYLKYLKNADNPNGEDIIKIKKYNQIVINLYKNRKITTISDNYKMWLSLGISKILGIKVKKKAEEFLKNKKLVDCIKSIYKEMIKSQRK